VSETHFLSIQSDGHPRKLRQGVREFVDCEYVEKSAASQQNVREFVDCEYVEMSAASQQRVSSRKQPRAAADLIDQAGQGLQRLVQAEAKKHRTMPTPPQCSLQLLPELIAAAEAAPAATAAAAAAASSSAREAYPAPGELLDERIE